MSASEPQASESKTLDDSSPQSPDRPAEENPKPLDEEPQNPSSDNGGEEVKDEDEDEEEEGECGFCLFMKAGGCRESFVAWEKCIEEAEKNKEDIVDKCFEITGALKECMEAHSDYYEPVLRAEKAAEAEAVKELEKESAEAKKKKEDEAPSSDI